MAKTWVVVAESSRARILELEKPTAPLRELEDLAHPKSRLREQDLTTDLPGRAFDSKGEGRHAMGQPVSPKEQESIAFAKTISDRLESARAEGLFDKLIIVAAPAFLGLLRKSLSDVTKKVVVEEIDKNLGQQRLDEIREHLKGLLPDRVK